LRKNKSKLSHYSISHHPQTDRPYVNNDVLITDEEYLVVNLVIDRRWFPSRRIFRLVSHLNSLFVAKLRICHEFLGCPVGPRGRERLAALRHFNFCVLALAQTVEENRCAVKPVKLFVLVVCVHGVEHVFQSHLRDILVQQFEVPGIKRVYFIFALLEPVLNVELPLKSVETPRDRVFQRVLVQTKALVGPLRIKRVV